MKNFFKQSKGQTLIETLVAAFILTMGITAAVGLAIFALASSTSVAKQIIATGLAREGVEAVKNMRDTNWLKSSSIDADCYNYSTGANDAQCYKSWLDPAGGGNYDISPSGGNQTFYLSYDPTTNDSQIFWDLQSSPNRFGLDFDTNVTGGSFAGFYKPKTNTAHGSSDFYRKITLTTDNSAPYNQNEGPRLKVISQVWWTDKNCPRAADWPGLGKCSVEIQTVLTNWKTY